MHGRGLADLPAVPGRRFGEGGRRACNDRRVARDALERVGDGRDGGRGGTGRKRGMTEPMMHGSASGSTALMRVAQMAEADRLTIAAGTAGVVLMQNAGEAVAEGIMHRWPPGRVCGLCGPGHNSGDHLVGPRGLAASAWAQRTPLLRA